MMKKNILLFLIIFFAGNCPAIWIDSEPDTGRIGVGADAAGLFSIGLPPDPPDYPVVRNLLYTNYRDTAPGGAFVGFLIDGILYSVNPMLAMLYPDSAVDLLIHRVAAPSIDYPNRRIITEWFTEGDPFGSDSIYIVQTLHPWEAPGTVTVDISWVIWNYSDVPHDIGAILYMNVCGRVGCPVFPYSDSARVLPDTIHGWPVPPYWDAYQYHPLSGTLGIVARGDLSTPPNTLPDKFLWGENGLGVETFWCPDSVFPNYIDACVLMCWAPVTLVPGDSLFIQTSYGLADSSDFDYTAPYFTGIYPSAGDTVIPDTCIYITFADDESGIDITTLTIIVNGDTLDSGDYYISPAPGGYTIFYCDSFADSVTVFVYVGNAGFPVVAKDTSWTFYVTGTAIAESVRKPEAMTISAYPNPFNSAVRIILNYGSESAKLSSTMVVGPCRLEVFDINGRLVYKMPVEAQCAASAGRACSAPTTRKYKWTPDKNLTSGVYLVRIKGTKTSAKIILIR